MLKLASGRGRRPGSAFDRLEAFDGSWVPPLF